MPRQPFLALGVAALLLLSPATGPASTARAADEPHAAPAAAPAAHGTAAPHREAAGQPDILAPEPPLMVATLLVFLGLLGVLTRFAWKPLIAAMHGREEHLEHVLAETERARDESARLLAEHRERLAATEDQVRALIDEARKSAQATADAIQRKAQDEAEAAKERAQRDIATARDQALSEIWTKTADLAVAVAGKVLDKSITEDDHRRLIDTAISALPAGGPSANGHGA